MNDDSVVTLNGDHENGVKRHFDIPGHSRDTLVPAEIIEQWNSMSLVERENFEKRVVWKLDLRLIPWLSLLYLLSFLDRTNIGNAKLQGVRVLSSDD